MTKPAAQRSEGLLLAPFGVEWAVYDLVLDRVVVIDSVAAWLLRVGDEPLDALVEAASAATGTPPAIVEADLRVGIAALADVGLVGRTDPHPIAPALLPRRQLIGDERHFGATQALLGERLAFRSSDAGLLAEIDEWCGSSDRAGSPTVVFDVEPTPGGGVLLQASEEWRFTSRSSFLVQLLGVINDFASHTRTMLVVHAGAVRTADGRLIVLPGAPEAGKSTLTGALVQAGCDYLGDELVGVLSESLEAVGHPRALALDAQSREVLGLVGGIGGSPYVAPQVLRGGVVAIEGPAGPISEIVLPTFDPTTDGIQPVALAPLGALEALLESVMNLDRCGEAGWASLCRLAHEVPVRRVLHSGALELALHIVSGKPPPNA